MHIKESTIFNHSILKAIQKLLDQLSNKNIILTAEELQKQISSENSHLYLAEEDERVLGMLTLTIYQIPSGLQARIDDMVVEEKTRARGIGSALMQKAIAQCRMLGVKHISLTSHPRREAANRLYQRLGFDKYQTNVYRYRLDPDF